ncbi:MULTISPECIES: UPF0175 family protein [Spirulina sp. CCY15215]|uniref:UPF0175 family protein n=1 Tax=Spirulina sp. CCY15215 TaxID=2767591 RepID=UPI00194EFD3C|nr:UPF0175 family protein [Spirulina major]
MNITIPDAVLQENKIVEAELKQEIAIFLFQTKKLNLVQAGNLAQMDENQFQDLLADRQIFRHQDTDELKNSISSVQRKKSPLPRSVGMGSSGMGDLSERVDELLWQE